MSINTYADVTVVRNINPSHVGMYFDFLGPRGAFLNYLQDGAIPGDLFQQIWRNPTKKRSLDYALKNGFLVILTTPYNVNFDTVIGKVDVTAVSNGAVVPVNPDYGSYFGSAPNP